MSNREHRKKELNFQIHELYEELGSGPRVAEQLKLSRSTVWRRLHKAGMTKPKGFRRYTCIDCEKPTGGRTRCPFHTKVRKANMLQRWRQNQKKLTNSTIDGIH